VGAFLCQIKKHLGRAEQGPDEIGGYHGEDQRRINSPRSTHIELAKGKTTGPQIGQDVAGDEVAGNDKENIDPDEPSLKANDP